MTWLFRILAALGLLVVGWVLVTELPAVVHGHPAYAVALVLTVLGCAGALWVHRRSRPWVTGWRRVLSVVLVVGAVVWLAAIVWFRPFSAEEPALAAMDSDDRVLVEESATRVVLAPRSGTSSTGVFFQPGAKVEARAYAAVLRPLAEAGHRVVIAKQPLAIAFLATGAFDAAQQDYPEITSWVVGGHSLGGTVAALEAEENDEDRAAPVRGLLLYASYPGGDMSRSLTASVLSISGTEDGLATPEDIDESRANLPPGSRFSAIEGAVHAYFGDYGTQPGDGRPTISHDDARTEISGASVAFLAALSGAAG